MSISSAGTAMPIALKEKPEAPFFLLSPLLPDDAEGEPLLLVSPLVLDPDDPEDELLLLGALPRPCDTMLYVTPSALLVHENFSPRAGLDTVPPVLVSLSVPKLPRVLGVL